MNGSGDGKGVVEWVATTFQRRLEIFPFVSKKYYIIATGLKYILEKDGFDYSIALCTATI